MIIVRCRGGLEALQEKDEENGPDVSANDYLPFILGLYLGSKLAQEFEIHLQGGE